MGTDRSGAAHSKRPRWNGIVFLWLKLMLAFSLGAGATVASAYNTFETKEQHGLDKATFEGMLISHEARDMLRHQELMDRLELLYTFHLQSTPRARLTLEP